MENLNNHYIPENSYYHNTWDVKKEGKKVGTILATALVVHKDITMPPEIEKIAEQAKTIFCAQEPGTLQKNTEEWKAFADRALQELEIEKSPLIQVWHKHKGKMKFLEKGNALEELACHLEIEGKYNAINIRDTIQNEARAWEKGEEKADEAKEGQNRIIANSFRAKFDKSGMPLLIAGRDRLFGEQGIFQKLADAGYEVSTFDREAVVETETSYLGWLNPMNYLYPTK